MENLQGWVYRTRRNLRPPKLSKMLGPKFEIIEFIGWQSRPNKIIQLSSGRLPKIQC